MDKVKIIDFPKIPDSRGNLTFLEEKKHFPFAVSRVFWLYDVPGGGMRGGHAFRVQEEVIIALSGSFDVTVIGAQGEKQSWCLNRSYYGLYLPPMTWRYMENFSTNALSLHLCSQPFSEEDYIREISDFQ